MKETFYFSHDYNARLDEKIKKLFSKYGVLGYGVYWCIIEDLYNNANALHLHCDSIAYDLRVDEKIVESIIKDFNLFTINGDTFSSESVQRRLDKRSEKSSKARDSANERWKNKNANALRTQSDSNAIKESKVKEKKIKENKEIISKDIIISETKVSTLQEIIKNTFTLDFLKDIYEKYNLNKENFQEECELFLLYWTEKSLNGKKERWQKEKTFDPKLRFRTWMSNNKKWNKGKKDKMETHTNIETVF